MQTDEQSQGNIYLMGFMGCGKSLVGELLAHRLKHPFLDTDETIVRETGMSIPDIFEKQGEPVFRQLEKSCITRVSKQRGLVVALGGGAVLDLENWKKIFESGITITLSYPPHILASRLASEENRPLLKNTQNPSRLDRISALMKQREPAYMKADLVIHLNREISPEQIVDTLIGYLGVKE